jgi:hypothetical protein
MTHNMPDKQRRRLRGAQQNVKRWRKETQQVAEPCLDRIATALAAWRRFVSSAGSLPPDQARGLWQAALAEVATIANAASIILTLCSSAISTSP